MTRRTRSLLLAVMIAVIGVMAHAQTPPPSFALPAPTGPAPIGTTRWVVTDTSRRETFATGTRQVEVIAWHPAIASTAATAPYLRDGMEEASSFARLAKLGDAFDGLAAVKTHAVIDAPAAAAPARFPVILLQHGFTGLPSSHTALAEDLASHGWVVLSIVHPYEASAAKIADGSVVTMLDEKGTMRQEIREVLNEWAAEDATMTKITEAKEDAEKEQLMRRYLAALKNTDQVVRRWVLDMKAVLDRLPKDLAPGRLAARLDLSRIGAVGHSMGGVASGQFCAEDRRCKAGLNLDGIPQYGRMIDMKMEAPFLMVYSSRPGRAGASDIIYRAAASKYYRVDVKDTRHLDFTDMNFWGGPLRRRGAYGEIAPARAAEITRTVVREYFAQEILGQKSPLLAGATRWPDVTVSQ